MQHIGDEDIERFNLGLVNEDIERAAIELHLCSCPPCVARVEANERYFTLVRGRLARITDLD